MNNLIDSIYNEYLETSGDKIHADPEYRKQDDKYADALKKIESLLPDSEKSLVSIIDEATVHKTEIVEKKAFFHGTRMLIKFIKDVFSN